MNLSLWRMKKGRRSGRRAEMMHRGCVLALTGKASDAVANDHLRNHRIAINGSNACGCHCVLSYLARAYAELGQFDDAWRCIGEAMTAVETTKERWCEADIHRIAGEIALMSPEPDVAKAEAYFERALAVAREQQAKSWELRAAMSMARLWRDQGKRQQARDLLAPVYGWFRLMASSCVGGACTGTVGRLLAPENTIYVTDRAPMRSTVGGTVSASAAAV